MVPIQCNLHKEIEILINELAEISKRLFIEKRIFNFLNSIVDISRMEFWKFANLENI